MIKNKVLEKIILPLGDFIFKSNFSNRMSYWRKFKDFTFLELENYQNQQLFKQLKYATNNLATYQNIHISKADNVKDSLAKFPILTKNELRENPEQFIINKKATSIKIYSSGSTGESTYVSMSLKDVTSLQALQYHIWELCGYKIGFPLIQTGISPNRTFFKKLKDQLFGTTYILAFSLTDVQLENICKKLLKKNTYTIIGYPSSINIIAAYVLKNYSKIPVARIIGIGDAILPQYRKNIEKAFTCKILETYGSSEGFYIGFQEDLEYMYQYSPQVYLELLDDANNPVPDGTIGNVIVTRLDNERMPLIRYKVGDLAIRLPKENYPKDRKYNFPLLQKVIGRNTDVVILPDDRKLIVHSFTGIFEYVDEIKQFKIIQKDRNGILIEFIPDTTFNKEVLIQVEQSLQNFILDTNFKIDFVEVDKISSSKSGKIQLIESYLQKMNHV